MPRTESDGEKVTLPALPAPAWNLCLRGSRMESWSERCDAASVCPSVITLNGSYCHRTARPVPARLHAMPTSPESRTEKVVNVYGRKEAREEEKHELEMEMEMGKAGEREG